MTFCVLVSIPSFQYCFSFHFSYFSWWRPGGGCENTIRRCSSFSVNSTCLLFSNCTKSEVNNNYRGQTNINTSKTPIQRFISKAPMYLRSGLEQLTTSVQPSKKKYEVGEEQQLQKLTVPIVRLFTGEYKNNIIK